MKKNSTKKVRSIAVICALVVTVFVSNSYADCFTAPMGPLDSNDVNNIIDISSGLRVIVQTEYSFLMQQGYYDAARILRQMKNLAIRMNTNVRRGTLNNCSQVPDVYNEMDNILMDVEAQLHMDGMAIADIDRLINDIRAELDKITHLVALAW